MFAGACYGGCGKERSETETGIVRDSLVIDRPFPDEVVVLSEEKGSK